MAVHSIQITIPTGGGPTPIVVASGDNRLVRYIVFQNNSTHTMRIGDSTISSTVGYLLPASNAAPGPLAIGPNDVYFVYTDSFYVFGTAADVLDVMFIT